MKNTKKTTKKPLGYYHGENSAKKLGDVNKRTPEYNAWRNMYKRCNYQRFDIFHNETYINRNITICARWRKPKGVGFINFLNDLGRKPGQIKKGQGGLPLPGPEPDLGYMIDPTICQAVENTSAGP